MAVKVRIINVHVAHGSGGIGSGTSTAEAAQSPTSLLPPPLLLTQDWVPRHGSRLLLHRARAGQLHKSSQPLAVPGGQGLAVCRRLGRAAAAGLLHAADAVPLPLARLVQHPHDVALADAARVGLALQVQGGAGAGMRRHALWDDRKPGRLLSARRLQPAATLSSPLHPSHGSRLQGTGGGRTDCTLRRPPSSCAH